MTKKITKSDDNYKHIVEMIDAIIVETRVAQNTVLLEGKYEIGETIRHNTTNSKNVTALVQYISEDLGIRERELWDCVAFYDRRDELMKLPEWNKKISWNKVKLLLSNKEPEKPCDHPETVEIKIKVCAKCGNRVS